MPTIAERHAFVSYAREDAACANRIAAELLRSNVPTFIDSRIEVGERWDEALDAAIDAAFAVVVLWSPRSVHSRWVRKEARHGLGRDILCPAFIAQCIVPLEFSDVQAANFMNWPLGVEKCEDWGNLIAKLTRLQSENSSPRTDATLFCELGRKYLLGRGVPQNAELAMKWLKMALEAGHPSAADLMKQASEMRKT